MAIDIATDNKTSSQNNHGMKSFQQKHTRINENKKGNQNKTKWH
jgi:hypothetical protein